MSPFPVRTGSVRNDLHLHVNGLHLEVPHVEQGAVEESLNGYHSRSKALSLRIHLAGQSNRAGAGSVQILTSRNRTLRSATPIRF
jgi:hypothetical protein